jgi:hypothetical protein
MGTKGGFGGKIASMEAILIFNLLNTRTLVKVKTWRPKHATSRPKWQASVAVFLGCPWDPTRLIWTFGLSIENLN